MFADPAAPAHHDWLEAEQDRLTRFFTSTGDDLDLYRWRDERGDPDPARPMPLYAVARLVHCLSVEHLLGRPDAGRRAASGIALLREEFRDPVHGGFLPAIGGDGHRDDALPGRKEAYGHAFVLLAGASGRTAGIEGAAELYGEAAEAIDTLLWEPAAATAIESCARNGSDIEPYRGQNANMHLMEAYLAAHEATGDDELTDRAERIAERLVRRGAPPHGWRVPEHYTATWRVDPDYGTADDPFRPSGTLVGHSLEWARLLLQLEALRPATSWTREAAVRLFDRAVADGWDRERGGFAYSVDFDGRVINPARMHWTIAEAIGAALWLWRATGEDTYREWYARFWSYADERVLDRDGGSWWHELDAHNAPSRQTWDGKPDLYHAWQATLYARVDGPYGIARAAEAGAIRSRREQHDGRKP